MPLGRSARTNGELQASCNGPSLHVRPNLRLGRPSQSCAGAIVSTRAMQNDGGRRRRMQNDGGRRRMQNDGGRRKMQNDGGRRRRRRRMRHLLGRL